MGYGDNNALSHVNTGSVSEHTQGTYNAMLQAESKFQKQREKWDQEHDKYLDEAAEKYYQKKLALHRAELEAEIQQKEKQLEKQRKNDVAAAEKTEEKIQKLKEKLNAKDEKNAKALDINASLTANANRLKENKGLFGDIAMNGFKTGIQDILSSFALNFRNDSGKTGFAGVVADGAKALTVGFSKLTASLSKLTKQLDTTIDDIADSQQKIDTRLQGWGGSTKSGSYWKQMSSDISKAIGGSTLVKQSDVVTNLKTLVSKGIAYNVEQRAFLMTIKDGIADTFNAEDATLTKLVRIQQQDTTASRLGMESALTSFLNNMYETTEYMQGAAESIRSNLYEAEALMGANSATEFEYEVQKWMGSLYSVGFSNTSSLSQVLGQLAAGDISSLNGEGAGNLMIMAANNAGLNIADILSGGLDANQTNTLMAAMVDYLADIYDETKNSNVVSQQVAKVYGLTASDLKAAASLASSASDVYNNTLNTSGMLKQLSNMMSSYGSRLSLGQKIGNGLNNLNYSVANGIATNTGLYMTYKAAELLEDYTGGISIPTVTVMGSSVDLNTTVAQLMKVGVAGLSALSGMGSIFGGLTATGSDLLNKMGIGTTAAVSRGSGTGLLTTGGSFTSESGYVGNSSGTDVYNTYTSQASDETESTLAEAEEESTETKLSTVNDNIVSILTLLQDVTTGISSFYVTCPASGTENGLNTGGQGA